MLLMHVHATALQTTHGISVGPRITRDLWPVVDQASLCRMDCLADDASLTFGTELRVVINANCVARDG